MIELTTPLISFLDIINDPHTNTDLKLLKFLPCSETISNKDEDSTSCSDSESVSTVCLCNAPSDI